MDQPTGRLRRRERALHDSDLLDGRTDERARAARRSSLSVTHRQVGRSCSWIRVVPVGFPGPEPREDPSHPRPASSPRWRSRTTSHPGVGCIGLDQADSAGGDPRSRERSPPGGAYGTSSARQQHLPHGRHGGITAHHERRRAGRRRCEPPRARRSRTRAPLTTTHDIELSPLDTAAKA